MGVKMLFFLLFRWLFFSSTLDKKCVMLNSYNLFVTVRCWNPLLEMFHIICASCGESCDQFQLRLAGRNVSMHNRLGHLGWFWGAFHGFWGFVVIWLACLCFLNVFLWMERQVNGQVFILQTYGCKAVAIFWACEINGVTLWLETCTALWDLYAQKVKNVLNYLKVKLQNSGLF